MHGNIHQVLLGTRKGGKNEKTKRNSCPDSDLTYPYTQYSSTASELHYSFRSPQSRLNYRQTKNPHESTTFQRRRRDASHRKYTGGGRSTRPDQTQLPARFAPSFLFSFFFSFFFFFFFFCFEDERRRKKHSKNAYELNDGSLSLSDSYSAVRSAQRPAR